MGRGGRRKEPAGGGDPGEGRTRLNVKLVAGATATGSLWETEGILRVEPLFQDEDDEELLRVYLVEVRASVADQLTRMFEEDRTIEYVEAPPRRRVVDSSNTAQPARNRK